MIPRQALPVLRERLREVPAVVLLGPRQVGKTTLARVIEREYRGKALYLDLERDADRRRLADADAYPRAQTGRLVILDEIHRTPDLFRTLRGVIDEPRAAGGLRGTWGNRDVASWRWGHRHIPFRPHGETVRS